MVAARVGVPDVDRLANSLSGEQWEEWLLFGMVDGWFKDVWKWHEPKDDKLTIDTAKQYFGAKYGTT